MLLQKKRAEIKLSPPIYKDKKCMVWPYNNSLLCFTSSLERITFRMKYIYQIFKKRSYCVVRHKQISLEESLWDQKTVNTRNSDLIKWNNEFFTSTFKRFFPFIPLWLHLACPYKMKYQALWQHQRNCVCREGLRGILVLSKDAKL